MSGGGGDDNVDGDDGNDISFGGSGDDNMVAGDGDVKYHLGYHSVRRLASAAQVEIRRTAA